MEKLFKKSVTVHFNIFSYKISYYKHLIILRLAENDRCPKFSVYADNQHYQLFSSTRKSLLIIVCISARNN